MAKTLEEFAQLEPLWDKAIQHPAETSPDEKHQLMQWPPLEEMQANTTKYLGMSVENLLQKAATDRQSLTYAECRLIHDHFRITRILDNGDQFAWLQMRPDLYDKLKQAQEAVLSPIELQAVQAVNEVYPQKKYDEYMARHEKRKQEPFPDLKDWVRKIVLREDDKSWGYVFYHQKGMARLDEFRALFAEVLEMSFFFEGYEEIHDHKFAQFVPFEADESDIGHLQQDFRDRRERGDLKPGVLKNVFFLLTDEALSACGTYGPDMYYGWIWAIDPDWPLSRPDEDGYDGRLKISITQIFYRFYEFMSDGFSLREIWQDFHYVNANKLYPSSWPEPISWHFTRLENSKWPYN
ncbi:similar to An14g07400 [Aspergillus niger]|uniref:Similar to An14g07400 n=1 Tax=Aspergillus niger TaxID=5061 RepID=A0A100IUP9_ASPNG|nr:similar to An14g07400 [Aspergillus niger]